MSYALIESPLGPLGLYWRETVLIGLELDPVGFESRSVSDRQAERPGEEGNETPPGAMTHQLNAYFEGRCFVFDLPLALAGTPFQQRVWAALQAIPPGQTRTYGELARELGSAPRAIGQACRANPCPIVVPCHRVVARQGLGGFAGDTSGRRLAAKRWLLEHEGAIHAP